MTNDFSWPCDEKAETGVITTRMTEGKCSIEKNGKQMFDGHENILV